MSRRIKRAFIILLGVGIAVGVGAAITWVPTGAPLLTRCAKRVAALPFRNVTYDWVSDHEFVMFSIYPRQPLSRMETRTGARTALGGLQRCMDEDSDYYSFALAPDGTRALWGAITSDNLMMTSARLDGSSITKRTPKHGKYWSHASNPIWMPNGRQWVRLITDSYELYTVVEGLDSPGDTRESPLGEPKGPGREFGPTGAHLLGCTQTGRILATPVGFDSAQSQAPQQTIKFIEFSVDGGPSRYQQVTISLPAALESHNEYDGLSHGEEVALSPRGDRLAWIIHVTEEEPPLRTWLARWLPALRKAPRARTELRTSRLDGSDMKILGTMEMGPDGYNIKALRWLPDGESVSFIYEGALWTVAAQYRQSREHGNE